MKKAIHKSFSLVMALVVLFSTLSFNKISHFCGDNLVDSSIFSNLKTCGMDMESMVVASQSSADCAITKKNCCSEENELVQGQDELQLTFDQLTLDQHVFVATFVTTYVMLFEPVKELTPNVKAYPPPLIVKPIYKLDETYLI